MISEAMSVFIGGIICFVFGLCLFFFPRKFQEQAIRDWKRFPWRHLTLFANRVDKPGYLNEVRIGGALAIVMGIVVIMTLLFGHISATVELFTANSSSAATQNVRQIHKP